MALHYSNERLNRLQQVLICPECKADLEFTKNAASCKKCGENYPVENDKIYFVKVPASSEDSTDKMKEKLKRMMGKYYYSVGVNIIAPTYPFNFLKQINKYIDITQGIVVDIGSGNNRLDDDIICLDLFDYANVDIVCDVENIPFRDSSIDAFVSRSMLEHVPHPEKVVDQAHRLTRPGGFSLHLIPFMYPFHASPYDFHRFTDRGAQILFERWELIDQSNRTGPFTQLLNLLIEFFSILLSFGNLRAKAATGFILSALLFPIKFLDAPFIDKKSFMAIAPTILTVVRKRAD